jgi:ABC-type antimicrobial peptide transport system permease subunit
MTPTWVLFSPNVTVIRVVQGLQTVLWTAVLAFLVLGVLVLGERHPAPEGARTP